ncbi:catalase [Xylariaceae sp. FL1272]|nr:catalase [Xylariaceae sp. FL1272]
MMSTIDVVKDMAKNVINGEKGRKIAQLEAHTTEVRPEQRLTTDFGVKHPEPAPDNWLRVNRDDQTGPMLLEDNFARERIHRFDHERIPERVVHARGSGAFGNFKLFESAEDVTCAGVLTDTSRETPVFVRFSTVQGSRGSADTVRDVRGFAVKFYTQEGNWDIVGNNIPVFFIQDSVKFPDIVHAVKPEPHNEVPQAQSAHNNFWDFVFMHEEATHMYMWTMSDRAIPRSFRMMQGFGVNTFTLINKNGERHFVKFHWTPQLGVHSLVWDEALKLAGQDPDFHRKDLWEAIENGAYPKWNFGIQVIPESKEHDFDFDILDATKLWPEDLVPVRYIGELELNRNVDEFFSETEQVAFCTSHMVPGIGQSDDPLLQGRSFSYFDTQLSRLGTNWQELPINQPVCPVMNFNRDGKGRHRIDRGTVNYWPNRFEARPPAAQGEPGAYIEPKAPVSGVKERKTSAKFKEHYNQAQMFYNSLTPPEKAHLTAAFAFELDHCDDPIVYERMSQRLADIDVELAKEVAELVGGPKPNKPGRTNHGKKAKNLSQTEIQPSTPTIASRRVAILIADGFDRIAYDGMKTALKASGALPFTIGVRRSEVFPTGVEREPGNGITPDHHLEGMRSTMFDAIFVPGGAEHVQKLMKSGRAVHWAREAFGHLKAIGATGEGVQLLRAAFALPGVEFSNDEKIVESYGVVTMGKQSPDHFKDVLKAVKGAVGFVPAFFKNIAQHKNFDRELDGLSSQVAY